jgi:peptidyl-prolyl cis-trans isomerase SurA
MENPIEMSVPFGRSILIPILIFFLSSSLSAQSLFTVDGTGVSKEEFMKAYIKNNNHPATTPTSYRDYLELYIRYKLKVRAAFDAQLDTLPAQRTELQNFRSQVAETYLKDEGSLDKLVKEAYVRGQKDLLLEHIYIALPKNASVNDTLRGYEKAMSAYEALKKGKKFGDVATIVSDDPSVKNNRGRIGYITVFTLPYELENLAYSLSPGQFSKPYHSKGGYHIFKIIAERKSLGRIKIAQLLLPFPPAATPATQDAVRHRADSLDILLQNGADFAGMAKAYSGDNLSYQNGGELPEFGVGKYDSAFEATAYGLDRDGAISRPLLSTYGYHIIKRIDRKPFPREFDAESAATLKQQVLNDPRVEVSRQALLARIYRATNFRRADFPEEDLWAFTDSVQHNPALPSYRDLSYSTVLFSFDDRHYSVKEWLDYSRTVKPQRSGAGVADKDLFRRYVERSAMEYYRNHLELYNPDFAFQLTEFKEGNLLFEIMQRKIWDKASADSAALKNYYEAHKDKYWWNASADALLFTCNNEKTAETLAAGLRSDGAGEWRKLSDGSGASVQADSGRYELAQIPGLSGANPAEGSLTAPVINKTDNTASFSYILHIYHDRSPRNFRDARGFVINDYQSWMEDQWVGELKKKYAVKIDETVLKSLPKQGS